MKERVINSGDVTTTKNNPFLRNDFKALYSSEIWTIDQGRANFLARGPHYVLQCDRWAGTVDLCLGHCPVLTNRT